MSAIPQNPIKIGVLVGSFQVHKLHSGHVQIILAMAKDYDALHIVVGRNPAYLTNINPLGVNFVVKMLKRTVTEILTTMQTKNVEFKINVLDDHPLDQVWSNRLDNLLVSKYSGLGDVDITYCGGSTSAISHYTGRFKTKQYDLEWNISSTDRRTEVLKHPLDTTDFLAGMIYAQSKRHGVPYPTVGIVVRNSLNQFLLGEKLNDTGLRVIGGFVDTYDTSYEDAALRELQEETGLVATDLINIDFVTSVKLDTWRYRKSKDSIIASLYVADLKSDIDILKAQAADDLTGLHWVPMDAIKANEYAILHSTHKPLGVELVRYYK